SWVLKNLPNILYHEERAVEQNSRESRQEPRVLRILVQEELHPITELTTAAELGEAFRGIFAC
ncbi:hypothetical protein C8R45DRAFT_777978, partial [Mycena sanguinolenta]